MQCPSPTFRLEEGKHESFFIKLSSSKPIRDIEDAIRIIVLFLVQVNSVSKIGLLVSVI